MDNYFKYLVPNEGDLDWGIYLLSVGKQSSAIGEDYPSKKHPSGYFFTWDKGRNLSEYQCIYITEGEGVFEDEAGTQNVRKGDLILIKPNIWHRYRPSPKVGWAESYIGFDGDIIRQIFEKSIFSGGNQIFKLGEYSSIGVLYDNVVKQTITERPGFQQVIAGLIMQLSGEIIQIKQSIVFSDKYLRSIIEKSRNYIRENVEKDINFIELASDNNISYSYFRKLFKEYTGSSPRQFHLSLKLIKAKELLVVSEHSINEISEYAGFGSVFYFSRYFKARVSMSPSTYRKQFRLSSRGE